VATSGAVASAALQGPSEAKTEASAEDCLNLDEQTLKAIFEAWMKQGGGFNEPTAGETTGETTGSTAGETTGSTVTSKVKTKSRDARPRAFHLGQKTASVPLSELSISACEGGPGSTPTDPGSTPTDPGSTPTHPGTEPPRTGTQPTDPGTTPPVTSTAS
jgi:hypothetical protein